MWAIILSTSDWQAAGVYGFLAASGGILLYTLLLQPCKAKATPTLPLATNWERSPDIPHLCRNCQKQFMCEFPDTFGNYVLDCADFNPDLPSQCGTCGIGCPAAERYRCPIIDIRNNQPATDHDQASRTASPSGMQQPGRN